MAEEATLTYSSAIPFFLSPLPSLSSSASTHLTTLLSPSHLEKSRQTKCYRCRAEIVGGVTGSYWTDEGALWARCDSCGWKTKRKDLPVAEGKAQLSRDRFMRVKKRRRMVTESKTMEHQKPVAALPGISTTARETAPSTFTVTSAALADSATPKALPPSPPSVTKSAEASNPSSSKPAKRKRAKPGGLAEMLEAKRKQASADGSGGVGLKDFLSSM